MSSSAATSTAVALEIPIVILVPPVIVNNHAAGTLPISFEEHLSLISCGYPARLRIRRARPVPVVPRIAAMNGIPVTFDPYVLRLRRRRSHVHHASWRWRANVNSDRYRRLRPCNRSVDQHARCDKRGLFQTVHAVTSDGSGATSDPAGFGRSDVSWRRSKRGKASPPRSAVSKVNVGTENCDCRRGLGVVLPTHHRTAPTMENRDPPVRPCRLLSRRRAR